MWQRFHVIGGLRFMSRVKEAFASGKAFIPFITAGDPSLEISEQLVLKMAENGADLIEIGIPFSDPVAEGEVIQKADARALEAGSTTDRIFSMVQRIREKSSVPLAFMTYVNPIFSYGSERFLQRCQEIGIDALIIPDLPFEEKEEVLPYSNKYGIELISLIAPTSQERVKLIASEAQGFVYCVSSMGVTGVRAEITTDVAEMVRQVKAVKDIPCAIGFGISTPEQAAEMVKEADGVIVGSAIVKIVEQYGIGCVPRVEEYVKAMKKAISF